MDKRINLPFEKKLMFRLLLLIGMGLLVFTGCKKTDSLSSPRQVKAQAVIDDQLIQKYMAANNLNGKFTQAIKDSTGLWYMITKDTTTATLYSPSSNITVGYTGRIISSKDLSEQVFIKTDNLHPAFTLSQMIRAWNLCLPKCKKGASIRIIAASRYAYGPYPQPLIGSIGLPANAVLDFDITVYDVVN